MIRLSKSCIGQDEKDAVIGVLDNEFLGMGDEVREFEDLLKNFFGRPVVCVNTGTSALHLAVQAIGINPGDEILVPSLTYVASFQAISAAGAVPIPCDIDPESLNIDAADAESRITSKTKAIMPVHYSGSCGLLKDIYSLAESRKLRVIEDAAHAFGSYYDGKKIGSFGDIACFSFDGIKNITSGEGGCIVSDDPDIIRRCQDARLLGVEYDTEKRFSGERSWEFDVREQGWRYHMSNIMAAIGIAQLKKFPAMALKRQELALSYDKQLNEMGSLRYFSRNYSKIVPHIYVIQLSENINRTMVRKELLSQGIQTGIHYQPNHQLSFYAGNTNHPLPETERVSPYLLSLPLHCDLDLKDVAFVTEQLENILLR